MSDPTINQLQQNRGVIIETKITDFIAGVLPYQVVNPLGDWSGFEPRGENQFSNHQDSMACVTFSALNCIETQYKFLTGKEINFSDRFIAKLSGTTQQGNTIQKVLDTIRKYGLVLETEWPTPASFSWDEYYATIPPEVLAKARKFTIGYEFGSPDYAHDLKQAPLQMIIVKDNPYHAVEMINLTRQFDSYPPYDEMQQSIHTVCKIILKGVPMTEFVRNLSVPGEFGLLISSPVCKTYVPASTEIDLKARGGDNIPLKADGTVDYTKARDITL